MSDTEKALAKVKELRVEKCETQLDICEDFEDVCESCRVYFILCNVLQSEADDEAQDETEFYEGFRKGQVSML